MYMYIRIRLAPLAHRPIPASLYFTLLNTAPPRVYNWKHVSVCLSLTHGVEQRQEDTCSVFPSTELFTRVWTDQILKSAMASKNSKTKKGKPKESEEKTRVYNPNWEKEAWAKGQEVCNILDHDIQVSNN